MEGSVLRYSITTSYKVGVATLGIGILWNIVGVASPGWAISRNFVRNSNIIGLWMACSNVFCGSISDFPKPDILKVCEALSLLGIILDGFAFILAVIFLVLPMAGEVPPKALTNTAFALGLFGAICTIVCLVLFGTRYIVDIGDGDLFYSFYLTAVSLLPIIVGTVVIFSQGLRYGRTNVPL